MEHDYICSYCEAEYKIIADDCINEACHCPFCGTLIEPDNEDEDSDKEYE